MEWYRAKSVNVDMYTVERSLSADGPWEIRRNLTGSVFTDTQLDHDTEYHYRVQPAEYPDIVSEPGSVIPARFHDGVLSYRDARFAHDRLGHRSRGRRLLRLRGRS